MYDKYLTKNKTVMIYPKHIIYKSVYITLRHFFICIYVIDHYNIHFQAHIYEYLHTNKIRNLFKKLPNLLSQKQYESWLKFYGLTQKHSMNTKLLLCNKENLTIM